MAQGDYLIQNQSFPSFRSDLNSTLEAINTSNSGTSRPSSAVAGTVWLDTTNATNPTLKFFDGTDDISLAQLDYSANTVNWLDSTVVADLVNDTTPQLGGDLDVNGNSIVSVSNGNITFTPDGTGKVIIDGLSYPSSDGTSGQFLKTDGAGNLSFDTVTTAGTVLTTQGDILYRDGSGLARLGAGTSGQLLQTNGTGSNPSWVDAAGGGGKVLQVLQTVVTNRQSGSGGWNDVTGLSVSITPSATSSKILVMGNLSAGFPNQYGFARFMRDTTAIGIADANSSNQRASFGNFYNGDDNDWATYAQIFLDTPSTTSATTYKIQVYSESSTYYINYGGAGSTLSSRGNGISTITVMEIGA